MARRQFSRYAKEIDLQDLSGSTAPTNEGAIFLMSGSLKHLATSTTFAGAVSGAGNLQVGGTLAVADAVIVDASRNVANVVNIDASGDLTVGSITGPSVFSVDSSANVIADAYKTNGNEFVVSSAGHMTAVASVTSSGDAKVAGNVYANGDILGDSSTNVRGILTLTASHAQIGTLDVNTINSITQTNTTLEVADANIIAGAGANTSAAADGAGLQIGGNAGEGGYASVLYEATGTKMLLKVSGSTYADLRASGLHVTGRVSSSLGLSGSSLALAGSEIVDASKNLKNVANIDGSGDITVASITMSEFSVDSSGNTDVDGTLNVEGVPTFQAGAVFSGGVTTANAIAGATTVSGSGKFSAGGGIDAGHGAPFTVSSAGAMVAATAKVSDLTSGRVLLAGTAGELQDNANLTFVSNLLALSGGLIQDGITQDGTVAMGFQDDNENLFASVTKNSLNLKAGTALLSFNNLAGAESAKINHSSNTLILSSSNDVQVQGPGALGVVGRTHLSGALQVDGNATFSGQADLNGDVNLGNAVSDTITVTGQFDSNLLPSSDGVRDLGSSTREWKDLYIDGIAYLDGADIGTLEGHLDANSKNITGIANLQAVGSSIILGDNPSDVIRMTGSILINGDITLPDDHVMRASAFDTYSDITLKKDIKPMDNALEKVMKLEPVTYEMKSAPGRADLGFIAQDVAKVVPEVCGLDANGIGRSIDYGRMSAVIAGAVKAQQAQIEELKAVIEKLQK